jgi:hypothetical protein
MVGFGDTFCLTMLTTDPSLASEGDRAGVERIGVDLERLGKAARQAGQNTRLSEHSWEDLARIRTCVTRGDLFVRLNQMHPGSEAEIEKAIDLKADVIMLPYFHTVDEVKTFANFIRGRAQVILLLETAAALVRLREIVRVPGVDEIMIGLNDLRIQLGVRPFELLVSPLLDTASREVRDAGRAFTIGGVGRHDDESLTVDPDLVYAQYPRLKATGAWLSRSFFSNPPSGWNLTTGLETLRARMSYWGNATPEMLMDAKNALRRAVS